MERAKVLGEGFALGRTRETEKKKGKRKKG